MSDDGVPAAADRPARSHPRGSSRRDFLVAGAIGVLAAGGGVAVGVATTRSSPRRKPESQRVLVAAISAERALIARVDATSHPDQALHRLRIDHAAHLRALQAAAGQAAQIPAASPAPTQARTTTRAELRAAEQQASTRAAQRAVHLSGRDAVLLASIAACEATHAVLLG